MSGLIGAYTKTARWATARGMGSALSLLVGPLSFVGRFWVFFNLFIFCCFAEVMVQERPTAVSVLDKHRQKVAERKGRRSLEVLPPKADRAEKSKGTARPSHKSKKRPRDGGNVATTTRSLGSMPTPPPRREAAEVAPPSPRPVERGAGPSKTDAWASPSPFDILGSGYQFTRRVRVTLPDETRESFRDVSPSDLLRGGFELMCRSFVLVQNGIQGRDCQAEDVSQLEHQLAEATEDLKQSLAANNDLSVRIAQEAAERELAQKDVVEARQHLEVEKLRAAVELAEVRKMIEERDEKLSSSVTELAALQAAKDQAEAELDENYEESEELLKQCFNRAVRQAHVLYGGPPASGEFDIDCEVHQGWLVPSFEVAPLTAQEAGTTETQEGEAEEGECVEIQD